MINKNYVQHAYVQIATPVKQLVGHEYIIQSVEIPLTGYQFIKVAVSYENWELFNCAVTFLVYPNIHSHIVITDNYYLHLN